MKNNNSLNKILIIGVVFLIMVIPLYFIHPFLALVCVSASITFIVGFPLIVGLICMVGSLGVKK